MLDSYTKGRLSAEVLIVGGGVGGVAAALAVTDLGGRAILTEETDWLGGQMTSQGVPPDEHFWIENHGRTGRYHQFRERVREYYRRNYPLCSEASLLFDPGLGGVSRIAHEPRIAQAVIEEMLAPAISSGRLRVLRECLPVAVEKSAGRIGAIHFQEKNTGKTFSINGDFVLDATEAGDLLALGEIPYVTGSEGRACHGELHDRFEEARPDNLQAITWAAALGFDPRSEEGCERHLIAKPKGYERWQGYVPLLTPAWTGPLLSWRYSRPRTLQPTEAQIFGGPEQEGVDLWRYRRILAAENFAGEQTWDEVSVINWPQNDYLERSVIDTPLEEREAAYRESRELTLSLIYWLQHHAPRRDGGIGYPGLYLRGDVMGTSDGLAKAPYLREVRRIKALRAVTELDIGVRAREGNRPERFRDSVGTGYYRIDLHPSTGGDNYVDLESFPFQIPFSSMVAPGLDNFLPAAKNIGTTHISNGCYRLHPVEWNIGEAAGSAALLCLKKVTTPEGIMADSGLISELQRSLEGQGVPLEWPDEVFLEHAAQRAKSDAATRVDALVTEVASPA